MPHQITSTLYPVYQLATQIPACNSTLQSSETSSSIVVTKNANTFLYDFVQMLTTNPSMRDSLMCALMQVYVTKLKGNHKNPELLAKSTFVDAAQATTGGTGGPVDVSSSSGRVLLHGGYSYWPPDDY